MRPSRDLEGVDRERRRRGSSRGATRPSASQSDGPTAIVVSGTDDDVAARRTPCSNDERRGTRARGAPHASPSRAHAPRSTRPHAEHPRRTARLGAATVATTRDASRPRRRRASARPRRTRRGFTSRRATRRARRCRSMSTVDAVPGDERADAFGRAGDEEIARLERHHAAHVRDERRHVEDHLRRRAVLPRRAVHAAAHARGRAGRAPSRSTGPTGQNVSKPFARVHCPSFFWRSRAVTSHDARVAEDVRERLLARHVARAAADDDAELGLVLDRRALRRKHDRRRRARGARDGGLKKRSGSVGTSLPELLRVRRVVATDAHNLGRLDRARGDPLSRQRSARARPTSDASPRRAGRGSRAIAVEARERRFLPSTESRAKRMASAVSET